MDTKIAMITAGILVAGLMVVASYTISVWAATSTGTSTDTSASTSGDSKTGSAASATGGGTIHGVPIIGSSTTASEGKAAGAGGFVNICGDTISILGACSGSSEDR